MNVLLRLGAVGFVGIFLGACGPEEEPKESAVSPAPPVAIEAPLSAPTTPEGPAAVDELHREFHKDEYNTMSGELVDGHLVNNGKGGFLLFGPYAAFQAGTYSVSFVGNIDELSAGQKVRLDVVSSKGKTSHALTELDKVGSISPFEFTLTEPVQDLEVRVLVPEGTDVSLQAYQVERLR